MWCGPHLVSDILTLHAQLQQCWTTNNSPQTHHAISSFCTFEWAVLSAYKLHSLLTDKYTPKPTNRQLKHTFFFKGLPDCSRKVEALLPMEIHSIMYTTTLAKIIEPHFTATAYFLIYFFTRFLGKKKKKHSFFSFTFPVLSRECGTKALKIYCWLKVD